ncbi:MAG TPA: 3-hydroxyacyl-CoA dehydrogenase family protein, partial [Chitinophagaceae bacterium]|nr:3-hydroxyacyl-CoA dehydrogenase family protein [Chitinophagaceae bacterium]
MRIVVLASEAARDELCSLLPEGVQVEGTGGLSALARHPEADAVFDLEFQNSPERVRQLKAAGKPVFIHSLLHTLEETDPSFVRINAWPGCFGTLVEAAARTGQRSGAEAILQQLGREVEWLPDTVGFVTPRVIASIINEAYYAWGEGVSTKEAIDTAMKLGT